MPDLIHFVTEATKDIKTLEEGYFNLKKYHENEILNLEIVYPYIDIAFISGSIWCEDTGLPPWELSTSLSVKFRTIEPFFIDL